MKIIKEVITSEWYLKCMLLTVISLQALFCLLMWLKWYTDWLKGVCVCLFWGGGVSYKAIANLACNGSLTLTGMLYSDLEYHRTVSAQSGELTSRAGNENDPYSIILLQSWLRGAIGTVLTALTSQCCSITAVREDMEPNCNHLCIITTTNRQVLWAVPNFTDSRSEIKRVVTFYSIYVKDT